MSNETKRNVFKDVVNTLHVMDGAPDDYCKELLDHYDAALPDDMPVIPKVYGDMIEDFKAGHYKLSELLNEWDWNYDEQELIARAWLDGYQVEVEK